MRNNGWYIPYWRRPKKKGKAHKQGNEEIARSDEQLEAVRQRWIERYRRTVRALRLMGLSVGSNRSDVQARYDMLRAARTVPARELDDAYHYLIRVLPPLERRKRRARAASGATAARRQTTTVAADTTAAAVADGNLADLPALDDEEIDDEEIDDDDEEVDDETADDEVRRTLEDEDDLADGDEVGPTDGGATVITYGDAGLAADEEDPPYSLPAGDDAERSGDG